MTLRGYHARLIAVMQHEMRTQKGMTTAVLMAVAASFAGKKDGGFKKIAGAMDDGIKELDKTLMGVFGSDGYRDKPEVVAMLEKFQTGDVIDPAAETIALQPERVEVAERSVSDMQKDIRKLDTIMGHLTGISKLNPLGGYDQGTPGVTQYDINSGDISGQLGRM